MDKIQQINVPQDRETSIRYISFGNFHFRYAYARSADLRTAKEKGQDALVIRTDGNRFVFALCDGVAQSFYGELAAQLLGENLVLWLSKLEVDISEETFRDLLHKKLTSLALDVNPQIQKTNIPEDLPPMVQHALKEKRTHIGSETTFVAGIIDIQAEKTFMAWMGDSRLRMWKSDASSIELKENLFLRNERWSTKSGPLGKVHTLNLNSIDLSHLVAYSDGIFTLDKYPMQHPYLSHYAMDILMSDDVAGMVDDDRCFLEIWHSDKLPEFENPSHHPFAVISILESSWMQKRKSGRSRVSLFCVWKDRAYVQDLIRYLTKEGFYQVTETKSLSLKHDLHKELSDAMDADVIIVCLSKQFDEQMETMTKLDIVEIFDLVIDHREKLVIPVRLDDCDVPLHLRRYHSVDLFQHAGYERLKYALRHHLNGYEEPKVMAAPPPLAAPPPRSIGHYALISIAAVFIFMLLDFVFTSRSSNLVASPPPPSLLWSQIATITMGLFTASILSLVPTIASKVVGFKNKARLSVAEILGFSIAVLGVAYSLFGLQGNGAWICFAIFIVAFLDIGAHLIDWFRESTFRRIDKTWQYKSLRKDAASFDKLYNYERILYATLPLGIVLGTFLGVFQKTTNAEIALLSVRAVTLSAFLILILITVKSIQQMITPMYHLPNPPSKPLVFTSKQREVIKNKEEKMFSLAIMSTDLRKLYLYDSTHNILLMFLFAYSFLTTYGLVFELKYLVALIIFATLLFSQLPYAWGQHLLHQKVLEPFEGLPKEEVREKIRKYAPLYPKFHFLGALLANGTAGGLAYFLLDNFIKGLFK